MARISDEDIERVRSASDIVQIASERVTLKRSGRKYKACCPFHNEKTPSFQVDPELGLWHCFGCGEGGDVFDFVMRLENIDFPDAVRLLAERAHIELEEAASGGPARPRGFKDRLYACMEETAAFYHKNLMRSPSTGASEARGYLGNRGMGSEVCRRWTLGYAPGRGALVRHLTDKGFTAEEMVSANVALANDLGQLRDRFYERVMFPIVDRFGHTIAFGGRVMGTGEPKYLNTGDTPVFSKSRNLYGVDKARDAITAEGYAVIVEGYTDTIAMHEAGIHNVVATLGTALTPQHLRMLRSFRPKRIVYLFDGDAAGQKAADRASEFIDGGITPESGSDYISFEVVVLPDDLDPAEFLSSYGGEGMRNVLGKSVPLIRFAIDRRLAAWDLSDPGQRNQAIVSSVSLLAPIKSSIIAADYAAYVADRLGCDLDIVRDALSKAEVRKRPDALDPPMPAEAAPRVETEQERIARECLSLVAARPELVELLGAESGNLQWPSETADAVCRGIVEYGKGADSARALIAAVDSRVPHAAAYLSAGTIQAADSEQAAAACRSLLAQLREHDLVSRIRSGNSRLKSAGNMSEEEYDDLFRNVTALQKELNRLRNEQH